MEIIFDNIIFSLQRAGGISHYWAELIKRHLKMNSDIAFIEHRENRNNIFRKELSIDDKSIIETFPPLQFARYFNPVIKETRLGIFHSSYYRATNQKNMVSVVTIHDFLYEYFREKLPRVVHSIQKKNAIKSADAIICVSENTKSDLLKFYPEVDYDKIKVIYHGVSEQYFPDVDNDRQFPQLEDIKHKQFLLYVGLIGKRDPHKKFDVVLEAAAELKNFDLVIVGGRSFTPDQKEELDKKLGNRYHHYLGVTNKELNYLYNNAFCFIYPSMYEGFGMPVLESMRAGCPVITTKCASIPEVAGDAALYLSEITKDSLISNINILTDPVVRDYYIQKGFEQVSKFSWDTCFEQTCNLYKEVYANKFQKEMKPA